MIDFHSHILPNVDDGSRNVEESITLLKMLGAQGVETVIATPHFYAQHEAIDDFLNRRGNALMQLSNEMPKEVPRVLCGAEVRYYSGIGRMNELKKLFIEKSKLLLLEMPMQRWTEYTVSELVELSSSGKVTPVVAHMERYMGLQSKEALYRLYQSDILMQFNASFFLGAFTKRKAFSMMGNGEIHFIGSDCHNVSSRPPTIGKAFDAIEKKLGKSFISQFNEFGNSMLNK